MKPCAATSGLVLAGGQASRMRAPGAASVDKGLLDLGGKPLVAHACAYLQPRVATVWISANRHAAEYARYGAVLADDPQFGAQPGPLAGVAGALERIDTPWLLVVPVDVPLLPPDLKRRLSEALLESPAARLAYAHCGGPQPLCMLLHRDLLDGLREFLRGGGRKVQQWQARQGAIAVQFPEQEGIFLNINTPEDLCRAEHLLAARPV